jgi:CubicO group peptidase (beta-lactamase class C family)
MQNKHSLLTMLLVLLSSWVIAQPISNQQELNHSKAVQIVKYLNNNKWDSAYTLFSPNFKKAIDEEKWAAIKNQIGVYMPLQQLAFKQMRKKANKYKVNGGGINFQLFVGVDSLQLIEVFALQPYVDDATKTVAAATDNPKQTLVDKTVDTLVGQYINQLANVGVSVAVHYKAQTLYYNYGETKKGNQQLPSNKTIYEIGSITKTFTAALLAKAVLDKKVNLTDAITKYLPDSVANNQLLQNITLQQLSNHSSGLPRLPITMNFTVTNVQQPYENFSVNHLYGYLKNYTGYKQPGAQYEYSNLAVGLLGTILEKIYNTSFENLVQQYIAKPLQMSNTIISVSDSSQLAQGYNDEGAATPAWKFLSLSAAGSIKSNTANLMQYGLAQLQCNNKALEKIFKLTHPVTFEKDEQTVGLGWHIDSTATKIEYLNHSGGTYGCRSMLAVVPSKKMVVVVLANNATTGDGLGIQLVEALSKL